VWQQGSEVARWRRSEMGTQRGVEVACAAVGVLSLKGDASDLADLADLGVAHRPSPRLTGTISMMRGRLAPLDMVLVMQAMERDAARWMTNTRKRMLQWTNVCCRV
jgi:hypothetical protein